MLKSSGINSDGLERREAAIALPKKHVSCDSDLTISLNNLLIHPEGLFNANFAM